MTGLLVGGLGAPHDAFLAAALSGLGQPARPLGAMDVDALERGRAALPRGQCAPMLYTTGALLRAAAGRPRPRRLLEVQSCGPCRYALFGTGYARALERAGLPPIEMLSVGQSPEALLSLAGEGGARRLLDGLVVADVLAECGHRLRPYELTPGAVDAAAEVAAARVAEQIAGGVDPVAALGAVRDWHAGTWEVGPEPLGRAVLVGEPWSLHVRGDGRLHLPRVLARAGVEVEIAPLGTWVAYLAWQARQPAFGGDGRSRPGLAFVDELERWLDESYARASQALGIEGFAPPDLDELTALAEPYLTPSIRGGYGHVEIGLALRARRDRLAHVVLSVKSFGCVPSAGISDAILPTALDDLPFLSLEVCADGEAARESRLMMRAASALDAAAGELEAAGGGLAPLAPLRPPRGPRRFASSHAEALARASGRAPTTRRGGPPSRAPARTAPRSGAR